MGIVKNNKNNYIFSIYYYQIYLETFETEHFNRKNNYFIIDNLELN